MSLTFLSQIKILLRFGHKLATSDYTLLCSNQSIMEAIESKNMMSNLNELHPYIIRMNFRIVSHN